MGFDCSYLRLFRFIDCNHMVNLRLNEKILQIKRRHIVILLIELAPLAIFFTGGIIIALLTFFISFSVPEIVTSFVPELLDLKIRLVALYIISIAMIIFWQMAFVIFANYYLDCWIVTNERTVHTELRSLFNRMLSSVPHARIQDITVNVSGIIPTILKYGNLQIQTAGKFHEFIFRQIPEPYKTKEIIFKAQKEYFRKKGRFNEEPEEPAIEISD